MINPLRSSLASELSSFDDVPLTLHFEQMSVTVTHDGFSIGSHRNCDLQQNDTSIPPLHSVIHTQQGAVWIEAANDETVLLVNDRPCRRMALRDGDHFLVGASTFVVRLGAVQHELLESPETLPTTKEDLASLSAEELCDRIFTEQSMIQELSTGERSGWEALLQAIEAVHGEPAPGEVTMAPTIPLSPEHVSYETLLGQIEELQETIVDRTRELSAQEVQVLASSSCLEESQQRVTQRLDELLDQLNKSDLPNELRASA